MELVLPASSYFPLQASNRNDQKMKEVVDFFDVPIFHS